MRTRYAVTAAVLLLAAGLPDGARAALPGFPAYVSLPASVAAKTDPEIEDYGQAEFQLPTKSEIYRGKRWFAYLDASSLGSDERAVVPRLAADMVRGGWQVVVKDEQRNPPLATFKLVRDGKEVWATAEGGFEIAFTVLERGAPPLRLDLAPPAGDSGRVADDADFLFLKRIPGSQLTETSRDDLPFLVTLEEGQEPAIVARGEVVKEYKAPPHAGRLGIVVTYRDALKAAGWQIVEENTAITTGDPNLTAHYAKGGVDLWVRVHAPGDYALHVADAGEERASARLKRDLDRTCAVAVYGVNFDFDKATLRPDSEPALAAILKLLTDYPDLAVELGGHTDNVGARAYNLKLSEARVNAVRAWLIARGVAAPRLTARGYADTQPVESNESPEGRAKNRRVELRKPDCRR